MAVLLFPHHGKTFYGEKSAETIFRAQLLPRIIQAHGLADARFRQLSDAIVRAVSRLTCKLDLDESATTEELIKNAWLSS
jgi:hypothetical protein